MILTHKSTVIYPVNMEYGWNFWFKVSFIISTSTTKIFLKSLHAKRMSFLFLSFVEKFTFLWSNSILLYSGLNPAWNFWLSTRFFWCLKMKSAVNILGYIGGQFYRFSRGCKPRENLCVQENTLKCSKLIHFKATKNWI